MQDLERNASLVSGEYGQGSPKPEDSVMRAVSLFLDGMTRSVIFSFGPSLVYRLVYGGSLKLGPDCALVAFPFALVSAAYLLGRALGSHGFLGRIIPDDKVPGRVARLCGVVVALLVFTFGAGLKSVVWLIMIRFVSGALMGRLCVLSLPPKPKPLISTTTGHPLLEDGTATQQTSPDRMEIEAGTVKIYLSAFALSILAGGLLYRHASNDATFRALTGSDHFTLSPLFLVGVSIAGESILRCLFSTCEQKPTTTDLSQDVRFQKSSSSAYRKVDVSKPQYPETAVAASLDDLERQRLESDGSEFFDCLSVLSGMDEETIMDVWEGDVGSQSLESQICRYVDRKCLDGNDNPSFVPAGDSPNTIPNNYLTFCNGNERKANAMYKASQQWRKKSNVWKIHRMPTPWFHEIRKSYPHYVHGISKKGYVVLYEQTGRMDLKSLFRGGCKVTDMLHYYTFLMEFLANHVSINGDVRERMDPAMRDQLSSWGLISVLDIGGVGMSQISTDVLSYLKGAGDIGNSHYPLGLKRAFAINAPFWASGVWGTFKGVIPDSVPVDVLSPKQFLDGLREYIDDDQIPKEYGGSSPYSLGEHPFDLALGDLIEEVARDGPDSSLDVETSSDPAIIGSALTDARSNSHLTPRTAQWQSEMSQPQNRLGTRRRRNEDVPTSPTSDVEWGANTDEIDDGKPHATQAIEEQIWLLVSVMFGLWGVVQGMLEVAIPLWILTPPELGGLGHAPSRSGVMMFSSTLVLLFVMRKEVFKVLSKIPRQAPMRSFRIGAGSQAVLILLLAAIPQTIEPEKRTDSVLVMTSTIIFLSCIVVASILGRVSVTNLHSFASFQMTDKTPKAYSWLSQKYGQDKLLTECHNGIFTKRLGLVTEILGVLFFAPLSYFSLQSRRASPLNGTFCLFFSAFAIAGIYVCSYALHLDGNGDFVPKKKRGRSQGWLRGVCSFFREVAIVAGSDVASLMDEMNVSFSPLLGRSAGNRE